MNKLNLGTYLAGRNSILDLIARLVIGACADHNFSGEYFLFRDIEAGIVEPSGIDFGPSDSDVFEDYALVTDEAYSLAKGYGWLSTTGLTSFSGQRGDSLLRVKVALQEGSFAIDVDNGAYTVDILFGSVSNKTDGVVITVNGVEDAFTPRPGPNVVRSYPVDVTDGQLNLAFTGAPGLDRIIRLAGIRLTPMDLRPFKGSGPTVDKATSVDRVFVSAQLSDRSQIERLDASVKVIQPQKFNGFSASSLSGSQELDRKQANIRDFAKNSFQNNVDELPGVRALNNILEEALLDI